MSRDEHPECPRVRRGERRGEHPHERLEVARALLRRSTEASSSSRTSAPSRPVPAILRELLPHGVRRGSVVVVRGSSSLLLAMLGEMSRDEAWVALVGLPALGLQAARQQGVDLARAVVVPRPQDRSAGVVASLVDGIDVVVCGPEVVLTDAERRRLTGRVRDRQAVLLSTSPWQGAAVDLDVPQRRWSGLEAGSGRLRDLQMVVARRDHGPERRLEVEPWARRAG